MLTEQIKKGRGEESLFYKQKASNQTVTMTGRNSHLQPDLLLNNDNNFNRDRIGSVDIKFHQQLLDDKASQNTFMLAAVDHNKTPVTVVKEQIINQNQNMMN